MKLYVKSNSFDGYLYIFKHGLGPGTNPKDVVIVKEKDLPNGYTAVWLDRFLTTSELKQYVTSDISSADHSRSKQTIISLCSLNDTLLNS